MYLGKTTKQWRADRAQCESVASAAFMLAERVLEEYPSMDQVELSELDDAMHVGNPQRQRAAVIKWLKTYEQHQWETHGASRPDTFIDVFQKIISSRLPRNTPNASHDAGGGAIRCE